MSCTGRRSSAALAQSACRCTSESRSTSPRGPPSVACRAAPGPLERAAGGHGRRCGEDDEDHGGERRQAEHAQQQSSSVSSGARTASSSSHDEKRLRGDGTGTRQADEHRVAAGEGEDCHRVAYARTGHASCARLADPSRRLGVVLIACGQWRDGGRAATCAAMGAQSNGCWQTSCAFAAGTPSSVPLVRSRGATVTGATCMALLVAALGERTVAAW